jgi:hypothetical protein
MPFEHTKLQPSSVQPGQLPTPEAQLDGTQTNTSGSPKFLQALGAQHLGSPMAMHDPPNWIVHGVAVAVGVAVSVAVAVGVLVPVLVVVAV